MRPERPSAYRRKKKRRTPPVVKFIFILVIITAIGFFVFYSIDNPEFYEGIRGKVISIYNDLRERDYTENTKINTDEVNNIYSFTREMDNTSSYISSYETYASSSKNSYTLLILIKYILHNLYFV